MPPRRANFSGKLSEVRTGSAQQQQQQQAVAQPTPARAAPPHQAAAAQHHGKTVFDLPTPATSKPGLPSNAAAAAAAEADEEDVCFICAEPFKYFSVGSCNHRTCHVCALRLRALYKKKECTYCKAENDDVIFTTSPDTPYDELPRTDFKDDRLKVMFESAEMMEDSLLLLRFNCPEKTCDYIAGGWPDLRQHSSHRHGAELCDVCIKFKKVFSHEQELYPPVLLPHHLPSRVPARGRPPALPRGMEITPEMGVHPMCQFCRSCFFADEDLAKHMKERHEECFVCKRAGTTAFFQGYPQLEDHFVKAHHPCYDPLCLEKKFVVFGSDMDLKVHQLAEHASQMSQRDIALARKVQVSMSFDEPRSAAGPSNSGGRERNNGRGQPAPRGESFPSLNGGGAAASSSRREAFGASLSTGGSRPAADDDDPDRVVMAEHAALLTRVSNLVDHSQAKMAVFRSVVGGYKSGQNGADDVIDTLYNIFDHDVDATAHVAAGAAMLLTGIDDDKKKDLLAKVSSWRRDHQADFPSQAPTPRASGSNVDRGVTRGTGYAGIASGRVIDVKQSLRGQASRQVWDRVERAASNPPASSSRPGPSSQPGPSTYATNFPAPLSSGPTPAQSVGRPASLVQPNVNRSPKPATGGGGRAVPGSTAWASQQSRTPPSASAFPAFPPPSASLGPAPRQAPVSVNYASSTLSTGGRSTPKAARPASLASFPSLPNADVSSAAERRALFEKPSKRQEMLMRVTGEGKAPAAAAWGSGASSGTTTPPQASSSTGAAAAPNGNGGGKKKGKGKEVLFTISARPR